MRAFSLGLIIPHTNGLFANQHHKRAKQHNSTTDRNWPITDNLRHLSLTANNITAEPTNQFTRTGHSVWYIWLTTTIHLTIMTSAKVVETPVTTTDNSPSQDYIHSQSNGFPAGFKQFTIPLSSWTSVTILICINFCIFFEFGITSNSPDCYFLLIERILNLKSRFVFL